MKNGYIVLYVGAEYTFSADANGRKKAVEFAISVKQNVYQRTVVNKTSTQVLEFKYKQ